MQNPNPQTYSDRIAELEAHIRLLNFQSGRTEMLRQRWKLIALMGWAVALGLIGGMIFA